MEPKISLISHGRTKGRGALAPNFSSIFQVLNRMLTWPVLPILSVIRLSRRKRFDGIRPKGNSNCMSVKCRDKNFVKFFS